jgi:hypothetical protein
VNQPAPEPPRQAAVSFEVAPVGHRPRRLDPGWIVVALVAALLLVAIAHPWQSTTPASAVAPGAGPSSPTAIPSLVPGGQPAASSGSSSAPIQVVTQDGSDADQLALDIRDLASDRGLWGVGVGAPVGPPLQPTLEIPALGEATDHAWWAWTEVQPVLGTTPTAGGSAAAIDALPVTKLCAGVPDLPTGAQVLLLTTPSETQDPVQLQDWPDVGWHDEPRDIQPLPGLGDLMPRRIGDVTYLELAGGAAWPDGRYEFHIDGRSPTSLTVCLGKP